MAVVPDFFAGALAVPITGALHIGLDTFGLALSGFFVLPVTVETARSCGRLAAAVARRGGKPRRRQIDLAIAATAQVEGVPLMTRNLADFEMVDKAPARGDASLVSSSCPRRRRPVRVEGGLSEPRREAAKSGRRAGRGGGARGRRVRVGDRPRRPPTRLRGERGPGGISVRARTSRWWTRPP